jgi:hypothetical protein
VYGLKTDLNVMGYFRERLSKLKRKLNAIKYTKCAIGFVLNYYKSSSLLVNPKTDDNDIWNVLREG